MDMTTDASHLAQLHDCHVNKLLQRAPNRRPKLDLVTSSDMRITHREFVTLNN